jgi:7-carboxy-7-deazaguanine synthase
MHIDDIVTEMQKLLPEGKFSRDKHLIITGGEPLLGWQRMYPDLIDEITNRKMNLTHMTFETNGTQFLSDDLYDWLYANSSYIQTTFSVSAKLPCSGEKWEDAIRPDVVKQYTLIPRNKTYLKFVVATKQDIDDAIVATNEYKDHGVHCPVYLMPVGGTNETYELNERNVADFCRDNGFRFSPRIQVPLYKNAWGT